MGKTAERASKKTELRWGYSKAPIALFKTTSDPDEPRFVTAGPSGNRLLAEMRPDPGFHPEDVEDAPIPPTEAEIREAQARIEELSARAAARTDAPLIEVKVEELGGPAVEPEQVRRGIRLEDDTFVDLTPYLKEIDERTNTDGMEVIAFIRREQVPRERIRDSYYLGSDGASALGFLRTLFAGMVGTQRVAVVKWTKNKRQAVGLIVPKLRKGKPHLLVLEMAWAEDWRDVPERADLSAISAPESQVEAAVDLIAAMADAAVSLDELTNDRARLLRELVERAHAGEFEGFTVPERPELPDNVIDLTALLKASVERVRDFTQVA